MASYFKLRISDLRDAPDPNIGWYYSDGFNSNIKVQFFFVEERTDSFQAVIGPDLNQALKTAIELDMVPTGEWQVSSDDYYLYIETDVPGRIFTQIFSAGNFPLTVAYTAKVYNYIADEVDYLQTTETGALLNAFNDNVLRFKIQNVEKVDITGNEQLPLTLYPSPTGEYYFNLKDYATTLINEGKFEDQILPDIQSDGYVYADPSLFLELQLSMEALAFAQSASFYFLKSVAQIANYAEKNINNNYLLIPKVTYYEGYPFDVPVFSRQFQAVTLRNKTTGHAVQLDFNQYVNRLFLSQGSQNFTIDDVLPIQTGINRLEFDFGATDKQILTVQKKESLCAPYFKFYRNGGGFGYIRFEPEVGIRNNAQEGESIRTDFNGIQNTLRRSITEKETTVQIEMQTEALEPWEMDNFQDFISSPRVEMYVSDLFQKQTVKSWVGVNVSSRSIDTKQPKASKLKQKVIVEFELYNLHL